jgi:hypothetical protein
MGLCRFTGQGLIMFPDKWKLQVKEIFGQGIGD